MAFILTIFIVCEYHLYHS